MNNWTNYTDNLKLLLDVERERRRRENGSSVKAQFRNAAQELQDTREFEVIISGPAETGKTFAALWRVDSFLREHSSAVGLLVREVQQSLYKTVLRTYDKVITLRSGIKVTAYGGSKPEWYDYSNGSRLYCAGLDKIGNLLSGEFDIIFVNQAEDISLNSWEVLTTRATGRAGHAPYSMVIGDCNPGSEHHWILKRKQVTLLKSRLEDNPTLFDDNGEITEQGKRTVGVLSDLTGVRYNRLYLGLWVNAEGVVYPEWNSAVHLIDWREPPVDWIRVRAIDFGYTNPFVCGWFAIDNDGNAYLYRQIYMAGRTVSEHAKQIKQLEHWYVTDEEGNPLVTPQGDYIISEDRELIYTTVADHDAEDRATLWQEGIDTLPAFKGISLGIQAVQARLKAKRLFIMRGSLVEIDDNLAEKHKPTCLEEEIESYVWQPVREGDNEKEIPVKKNDHALDMLRYFVCLLDSIGRELEKEESIAIDYQPYTISPY